jgi:hypothetical protein
MRTTNSIRYGTAIFITMFLFFSFNTKAQLYVNDGSQIGDVFTSAVGSDANNGSNASPFATIGKALSVATPGSIIYVDAGYYMQTKLTVSKSIKIYGANYNITAVGGSRNAESILDLTSNATGAHILINATAAVEWKGFKIEDNAVMASGQRHAIELATSNGHLIANNIFNRITTTPSAGAAEPRAVYVNPTAAGNTVTIDNNYFTGTATGLFSNQSWRRAIWKQAGTGTVNITNNKFENCRSHINNDEQFINTNISGNTFELGTTNTTAISLGGAVPLNGSFILGANDFRGIGTIVNCSAVASSFRLDATSSSYNGVPFASLTNAQLFSVESLIIHGMNAGRNGLVRVKAGHLFVIPATNNPLNNPVKGNIQSAINLASLGEVINIQNGTYEQDVLVNKAVTLNGESRTSTVIKGTYSGNNNGSAACVFVTAANAAMQHLTVTRNYGNNLNDWNACTKNQGVTVSGNAIVLDDIEVRDQRNGIYMPNATNFVVKNSFVHHNRTGFHLGVNNAGSKIINNIIHDNYTHGLLVNFSFTPNNITNLTVNNNSFERNWYSHVNFNSGTNYTSGGQNFNCNWFGNASPAVNATNTSEPGYTAQLPVQFGGTDPGAFNGAIRGANASLINFVPFLGVGTDASADAGFQPAANACGVALSNVQLANKQNVICYGAATGAATITYENGFSPVQYSVNNGAFINASANTIALNALSAGNYTVVVKDASGTSATLNFVITQPAAAVIPAVTISRSDLTYTGSNTNNTVFLGYGAQQLSLTANANYSNLSYSWTGNYLSSGNGSSVTFTPIAAGTQTISLTATDANGCIGTASVTLNVVDVRCGNNNDKVIICQPAGKSGKSQTICISPNAVPAHLSKGATLGTCISAGNQRTGDAMKANNVITEPNESFVRISPSVNNGTFTAEMHNFPSGKTALRIIDQKGRIIELRNINVSNATEYVRFNLNTVNGLYYLQTTLQGKTVTQKILIQR